MNLESSRGGRADGNRRDAAGGQSAAPQGQREHGSLGTVAWMEMARPYLQRAKVAQRHLLPLNLGLTSALILGRLASLAEPQRMSDLASYVEVEPQSITSLVDRLERVGFVRRQKHPTDRRAILLAVTDEGRAVAGKVEAALSQTLHGD